MRVLCTSILRPAARSGVTTYYKMLFDNFSRDSSVKFVLVTAWDAQRVWKWLAGLIRRIGYLVSFGNSQRQAAAEAAKYRLLLYFAFSKYRRKSFDLVHAQDIISAVAARKYFGKTMPVILSCHFNENPVTEEMILFGHLPEKWDAVAGKYSKWFSVPDCFHFVSEYAFQKSRFLIPPQRAVWIIPNGVTFVEFPEKEMDSYQIGDRPFVIINVGYMDERKNQQALLELAKDLVLLGFCHFKIILVGEGTQMNQIRLRAADLGVEQYVSFTGWAGPDKIFELLSQADIYVHTALNDNCPYAVLEAISQGVPVLGFGVGGLPEILDSKWLFTVNDCQAIAAFILKNMQDFRVIAEAQFKQAMSRFSIDKQLEYTRNMYRDLIYPSGYLSGNVASSALSSVS